MKWLRPALLTLITLLFDRGHNQVQIHINAMDKQLTKTSNHLYGHLTTQSQPCSQLEKNLKKDQTRYSAWSSWSRCVRGHRTRRKHCHQSRICGGRLVVQVVKCNQEVRRDIPATTRMQTLPTYEEVTLPNVLNHTVAMRKQMTNGNKMRHPRGYSAWTTWSPCSRKCTTVRKRHCRRPSLCGNQVIRQSAYCYFDGTYCQHWIRSRMPRRMDPDSYVESYMPTSLPSFNLKYVEPKCGIIGRYRGTSSDRMRGRMRDMLRIIGGRQAFAGKWPWQVAVLNRYKEAFCGGTLISLRWVVSAAHCVRRRLFVRLGEHDLLIQDRGEVEMPVTETVIHPHYNPDTVVNDVAMLRLPSPADPTLGHGIACLPTVKQTLSPQTSCVILGWGKRRAADVHGTRVLHEAQISTISQIVCRRSYWRYTITDNMVCAGKGRRDSCAGDSGGPLLCKDHAKYYLQGITSFGDGCGKSGKFGIYTRTAAYVPWMRAVMNKYNYDD